MIGRDDLLFLQNIVFHNVWGYIYIGLQVSLYKCSLIVLKVLASGLVRFSDPENYGSYSQTMFKIMMIRPKL